MISIMKTWRVLYEDVVLSIRWSQVAVWLRPLSFVQWSFCVEFCLKFGRGVSLFPKSEDVGLKILCWVSVGCKLLIGQGGRAFRNGWC